MPTSPDPRRRPQVPPGLSDPSLTRLLGADRPDPTDASEPPDLQRRLRALMDARIDRRSFLARSGAAMAAGTLASSGVLGLASRAAAAGFRPSGDAETLSAAIDPDYLRQVTETVVSFGDTPMGFRPGGSPANEQAADWIADEMRRVGIRRVQRLSVPIDRWVFNGGSVAVDGGPTYDVSSWGGVIGTPPRGIHAEVLDLGRGRAVDYEGVDATGKIVLVDWAFGDEWVNRQGHQATLEGALAVIFYTGRTAAGAFWNQRDDGLMGFDGTYDDDWVPFVFITRDAANDLLDRIEAGPTFVTLTSNVQLTRAEDGGVGHNVLGTIPGRDRADEFIIFTGHHDAWFHGAADDATAIAAMLGIARAIRDTGYEPRRTLLFLASTSEEYGYTDAYYEWLIGCWYAVTRDRTDWQRKAILTLDFELLGCGESADPAVPGERMLIRAHSEVLDHAVEKLEADPSRTPFGTLWQNTVWANADHFTLTAAGIPGLYFNTVGGHYLTHNYHTNFDTPDRCNFPYLRNNLEVINDIWVDHDRADLPLLDFVARATEAESRIAFVVDGTGIRQLPGVDQGAQDRLEAAVAEFRQAAEALEARLAAGPVRAVRRVAQDMTDAGRLILRRLVALDVFDQYIFPHQQIQRDATRMQLAVDRLQEGNPITALDLVRRTGLTNAGRHYAHETYTAELARHHPDFERLQWGEQAHLSPHVDVWQEFHSIAAKIDAGLTAPGDFADEIASLSSKVAVEYGRLNERLDQMADVFRRAASLLRSALRFAR
jgi:hypothetical protein